MRSKTEIALLSLLLLCVSQLGAALNADEIVYENFTVNVGQLFFAKVQGNDVDVNLLPSWVEYNQTAIYGIPQIQEFYTSDGKEKVDTIHLGNNVYALLTFALKEINVCEFQETLFIEAYQKKNYKEYTTKEISEIFQEFSVMMDLKITDLRAFPYKYLNLYRRETNDVYTDDEGSDPTENTLTIVWVLGCGSFDENEDLVNTVNVVKNNNINFRIIQGYFIDINWKSADAHIKEIDMSKFFETTTSSSFRTTRHANNLPPKRINSLPTYECIQGKACKLAIPAHTFIDEQSVDSLQYVVYSMNHGKSSFLEATYPIMQGVALESGEFDFRLDARDSMKQAASAPFRVVVTSEDKYDYSYNTVVDKNIKQIYGATACKFIDRLANVLKIDAEKIRINSIRPGTGDWQTTISWLYLPYQTKGTCDIEKIKSLKQKMSTKKHSAQQAFAKDMGKEVHVREVSLTLSGLCNSSSQDKIDSTSSILATHPKGIHKTTPTPDVKKSMESESILTAYLLPIILLALFVVLLIIIVIYCCMFKKDGKKGKNQLDYVTKGQPVVFPNELATDDDTASVATPMLVKDERPPLQPNLEGTTIHENPLYKAPSVARTSISTNNFNTSSTFRQPGSVNQRLPPPYVQP